MPTGVKSFEASAVIAASPAVIWDILVAGEAYPRWDSGVVRVEGRIAQGGTIKVVSEASPGRTFPVKVGNVNAATSMTWTGGMPLGLFRGVRTFRLTPGADGTTRFDMREEYSGVLASMMVRSIPDLGPSFTRFANGLKQRAEQSA